MSDQVGKPAGARTLSTLPSVVGGSCQPESRVIYASASLAAAPESSFSSANVKEHATLSARASVDHGVDVETMGEHVNRAADRGCCVSTCCASSFSGWDRSMNRSDPDMEILGILRHVEAIRRA